VSFLRFPGLMQRRVRKMLSRESVAVVRYEVFQQCVHVCSLAACECTRRPLSRAYRRPADSPRTPVSTVLY